MRYLLSLLFCFSCFAAEETRFAGTGSDSGTVISWDNPTRITADDSSVTKALNDTASDNQNTKILVADEFGFSLASDVTITGIEFHVDIRYCSEFTVDGTQITVKAVKAGTVQNDENKASGSLSDSCTFSVVTWGGDSDLWSNTWSYSDINDAGFGLALQFRLDEEDYIEIDYISCTITYTEGSGSLTGDDWWLMFLENN